MVHGLTNYLYITVHTWLIAITVRDLTTCKLPVKGTSRMPRKIVTSSSHGVPSP